MFDVRRTKALALGGFLLIAGTCGVVVAPAVASAAIHTFTVDTTADAHDAHPGDNACADSAGQCSLRAAMEEANAEASGSKITIDVPAGTYKLSLGTLALTHNTVAIVGTGAVLLKETGTSQIVSIASAVQASISDVSMKGGNAGSGDGGGLGNSGTTTLTSVTISKNTATQGGGIYNNKGANVDP